MSAESDPKAVVRVAEAQFRECHEILKTVKTTKARGLDADKLYSIQSKLGRSIYSLEHAIIGLKRRAKELEDQLKVSPTELLKKQRTYQASAIHAVEQVIDYGKALGDSYAWLFCGEDEDLVRRHYSHQRIKHLPVGIGGIGEIEFVSKVPRIGGHLVLYHGITTFLRIGDISLVNLKTGAIDGMGEIKTQKDGETTGMVDVSMITKKSTPVFTHPPLLGPLQPGPTDAKSVAFKARLERQVDKMKDTLAPRRPKLPAKPLDVEPRQLIFDPFPLEKLFDTSTPEKASSHISSPGVILLGLKSPAKSLTDHVFSDQPIDAIPIIQDASRAFAKLALPGSPDNASLMSYIQYPTHERYSLCFGAIPLMWWPIRQDVIDAMFTHAFVVMSVFNPAHLLARLKANGYVIRKETPVSGLSLETIQPNGVSLVFGLDTFFDMVARQLITEDSVFDMLVAMIEEMRAKNMPAQARVRLTMSYRPSTSSRRRRDEDAPGHSETGG